MGLIQKTALSIPAIAYIAWWIYALIFAIIPAYSVPIMALGGLTVWFIIATILFFTGGVFVLIVAFAFLILIIGD